MLKWGWWFEYSNLVCEHKRSVLESKPDPDSSCVQRVLKTVDGPCSFLGRPGLTNIKLHYPWKIIFLAGMACIAR